MWSFNILLSSFFKVHSHLRDIKKGRHCVSVCPFSVNRIGQLLPSNYLSDYSVIFLRGKTDFVQVFPNIF